MPLEAKLYRAVESAHFFRSKNGADCRLRLLKCARYSGQAASGRGSPFNRYWPVVSTTRNRALPLAMRS